MWLAKRLVTSQAKEWLTFRLGWVLNFSFCMVDSFSPAGVVFGKKNNIYNKMHIFAFVLLSNVKLGFISKENVCFNLYERLYLWRCYFASNEIKLTA
ncbi:hypothetical protein LINPERPRIM_LOCUS36336 [Linum perenne]